MSPRKQPTANSGVLQDPRHLIAQLRSGLRVLAGDKALVYDNVFLSH